MYDSGEGRSVQALRPKASRLKHPSTLTDTARLGYISHMEHFSR